MKIYVANRPLRSELSRIAPDKSISHRSAIFSLLSDKPSNIKNYLDDTQFIVITHRRGTMEAANVLYGVTTTLYLKGYIFKVSSLYLFTKTKRSS